MAAASKTTLKTYFNTGDVPTESQFAELIDSVRIVSLGLTGKKYVNDGAGVDPTGVSDSSAGIQAVINAAGATTLVFEGLYKLSSSVITAAAGQTWILKAGTKIWADGNSLAGGNNVIGLNDNVNIEAEAGCELYHVPSTVYAYVGIGCTGKYGWSVTGPLKITNISYGMSILGGGSGANQRRNGVVDGVRFHLCQSNAGAGTGTGLKLSSAAEYIEVRNCDFHSNEGYGFWNDKSGNSNIVNCRFNDNTLNGIRIIGDNQATPAANSDHLQVVGCQINHNGSYGIYIDSARYGVNVTGCEMFGNPPFSVINSMGVSFNGCGIAAGGANVEAGTYGKAVYVNGGYVLGTIATLNTFTGGGTLTLSNVQDNA
jgi:hypothetical protein